MPKGDVLGLCGNPCLSVHLICRASPKSRFQTEADPIARDVRFGSQTDVDHPTANGPL